MAGMQQMLMGAVDPPAPASFTHTLVAANVSGSYIGLYALAYGSMTPSTLEGYTVMTFAYDVNNGQLWLYLPEQSALSKTLVAKVILNGSTYNFADATFTAGYYDAQAELGDGNTWKWPIQTHITTGTYEVYFGA